MDITYIYHSCFLLELTDATLLFDYFKGTLPPIRNDKPLYIFASHRHHDHFNPVIFSLFSHFPDVRFILSYDINKNHIPKPLLTKTVLLAPGQSVAFSHFQVCILRSTDEGVAFFIKTPHYTLYHAGDLNHWYWQGEDESWNREMGRAYREEISKLSGHTIDLAFIPADPRLEDAFSLGAVEFAQTVCPRYIIPMHFREDTSASNRLKKLFLDMGLPTVVLPMEKPLQRLKI